VVEAELARLHGGQRRRPHVDRLVVARVDDLQGRPASERVWARAPSAHMPSPLAAA